MYVCLNISLFMSVCLCLSVSVSLSFQAMKHVLFCFSLSLSSLHSPSPPPPPPPPPLSVVGCRVREGFFLKDITVKGQGATNEPHIKLIFKNNYDLASFFYDLFLCILFPFFYVFLCIHT